MMARNEAIVITMTSLCATCDSSCAMTPSSSSFVQPPLQAIGHAENGMLLVFRPVAKAFGRSVGEIATRGLGMSASAQTRSTIAVQLRRLLRGNEPCPRRGESDLV